VRVRGADSIPFKGRLALKVLAPDGTVVDERAGENVVCTTGYTAIAAALAWSGIQDQASNLGILAPTYLTPLYGAVGSGTGAVAKADTQLQTELGRVVVSGTGATPASSTIAAMTTWLFYFPNPASTWTVAEAGVFANATSTANSGSMLDHWSFSPTVSVPTTNTLILEVSFTFGP
jgi:hypothetical protein